MMTEIELIVAKYSQMITNIAASRVNPSDVEDVVQDVFLRYCEKMPKFRDDGHAKGWLITVAINITRDRYRANEFTRRIDMSDETMSMYLSDEDFISAAEKKSDYLKRLAMLDPRTKAVLMLYFDCGYNIREIAEMYQIKDYIVKRILANGKRDYLKILEKEDGKNVKFKKYRKK